MKRVSFLLFLAVSISIIACDKEEPIEVEVTTTANIEGKIVTQLDLRNDTGFVFNLEPVSDVEVFAKISTSDLTTAQDPNFEYPSEIVSATTDAVGTYNLSVRAGTKDVTVIVYTNDFRRDVIIDSAGNVINETFSSQQDTLMIRQDQTKINDFIF